MYRGTAQHVLDYAECLKESVSLTTCITAHSCTVLYDVIAHIHVRESYDGSL